MTADVTYGFERPDQAEVVALIEELDAFQTALYPAESNHCVEVAALCDAAVSFVVARREGVAVGCGAVMMDERGWGELKRMFTRPELRGLGIARGVLRRLEERALEAGVGLLRLETGIHSADALRFYERAGFERCVAFGDYGPDPFSVFMEKRVLPD